MDRVQVVVVVESHTDNALPLGSFNSLPSSMPQQLGTPLLSLGRNTEGNRVFCPVAGLLTFWALPFVLLA